MRPGLILYGASTQTLIMLIVVNLLPGIASCMRLPFVTKAWVASLTTVVVSIYGQTIG